MNRIKILPDHVANQIAAGEVVERPVAVVKELIENSLDAGATRVEIEFRNGGKSLIRVEDNGCGMSSDDALLSLERHATSKIRAADDLLRVSSFGFRGEALPSIASVSRFTLRTRAGANPEGTELLVNGGKLIHQKACGMPSGTRITVEQLFNSVPARRKFLKTDKTESAHITQLVKLLATAHPEISFTLIENGRRVFQSPACPDLRGRIAEVFGNNLAEALIPFDAREDAAPSEAFAGSEGRSYELDTGDASRLRVSGLMGPPGFARATRHELVTFVNRRPVDSRALNYAVIEAYQGYIPRNRYPVCFLFLEIDPSQVDVNVHPAKREARFRQEGLLRRVIITELVDRLRSASRGEGASSKPSPQGRNSSQESTQYTTTDTSSSQGRPPKFPGPANPPKSAGGPRESTSPATPGATPPQQPPADKPPTAGTAVKADPAGDGEATGKADTPCNQQTEPPGASEPPAQPPPGVVRPRAASASGQAPGQGGSDPFGPGGGQEPHPDAQPRDDALPGWRFIGRAHSDYALFEAPGGIVILRLKSARERIVYETVYDRLPESGQHSQQLLFPLPMELSPVIAQAISEHLEFFARNGFILEEFGRNAYRLTAAPDWLEPEEAESFARDLAHLIHERGINPEKKELTREAIARMAVERDRHSPARFSSSFIPQIEASAGGAWTADDARQIAARLLRCRNPLATPWGNPTYTQITCSELSRQFKPAT